MEPTRGTLLLAVLAFVFLAACSTTRAPAPSEAIQDLMAQPRIAVVHYKPEPFEMWTGEPHGARSVALGVMFGLIGGAIESGLQLGEAQEVGATFMPASQLTDPVIWVENRFLSVWQRELALAGLPKARLVRSDRTEHLQKQFRTDYVIDFRTQKWSVEPVVSGGLSSGPADTYRPTYTGRIRLVRLHDQRILWKGTCAYEKDQSLTPTLTLAEMTGEGRRTAVQAAMQTLAEACADSLWRQFFGRESGPDLAPTAVTNMRQ